MDGFNSAKLRHAHHSNIRLDLSARFGVSVSGMNAKDLKNLEEAARQWIISHENEIEVYEVYIRKDEVPDDLGDLEDPEDINALEEWLDGARLDYGTGFTMVKIEAENGAIGIALITVRGSSWEGLRIDLGGVFDSEDEARSWIESHAYILGP